jgi:preprotein translocase subunit SecF
MPEENQVTEKKKEEPKQEKQEKPRKSFGEWYHKGHKILLFISLAILAACIIYLIVFATQTGDIMNKDITLTGGTLLTIFTDQEYDLAEIENSISLETGRSVIVRSLKEAYSDKQLAITIETKADAEATQEAAENFFGFSLNEENSSIEMTGTALSESFYNELVLAIALAFVFMSIVVIIIFRKVVPAIAVIQAALMDIVFALAMSNIIGIRMSTAGIAALLMLIGYSVDTDIMLTTKVLKRREGTINSRLKGAFKTGIVMTLTSLIAVLVAYFFVEATLLKQMFLIISFGLTADIISTWLGNASILKWYAEKRNK